MGRVDQVEIAARLAAEEPAREAWLAGLRRDLGLVCAGQDQAERPGYSVVAAGPAWVSLDGIHFYEVPDGMGLTEFADHLLGKGPASGEARGAPD